MSQYKRMIESIFSESDFIDQLKNTFGITDKMQDGGLILPTGELIHIFDNGIGSLYDKVNADDNTSTDNSLYIFDRDNNFEENILDNNIIMYRFNVFIIRNIVSNIWIYNIRWITIKFI